MYKFLNICKYPLSRTHILVKASTLCTEGEQRDFLEVVQCVAVCEAISIHAQWHHIPCTLTSIVSHPSLNTCNIASGATHSVHFDDKKFFFYVLLECYSSLGFHNDYLLPNFQMGCKILKSLSLEFQKKFHIVHCLSWLSSILSTPFLQLSVKCRK